MLLAQRLEFRKRRLLSLSGIVQVLAQWKRNAKTRRALLALEEYRLKDIGIDQPTAVKEGKRMFWQ